MLKWCHELHLNNLHSNTNTNMNAMCALDFFRDVCSLYNKCCSITVLSAVFQRKRNQVIAIIFAAQKKHILNIYSL